MSVVQDFLLRDITITNIFVVTNTPVPTKRGIITNNAVRFTDGFDKVHIVSIAKGKHSLLTFKYKGANYYLRIVGKSGNDLIYDPYRVCADALVLCNGQGFSLDQILSQKQFAALVAQGEFLKY